MSITKIIYDIHLNPVTGVREGYELEVGEMPLDPVLFNSLPTPTVKKITQIEEGGACIANLSDGKSLEINSPYAIFWDGHF